MMATLLSHKLNILIKVYLKIKILNIFNICI
jgi:hypothetical protein